MDAYTTFDPQAAFSCFPKRFFPRVCLTPLWVKNRMKVGERREGSCVAIPYSRTVVGGLPWYSLLIVIGIALAVWLAEREEHRLGLPKDTMVDLALTAIPCGIVGARLYYVAMSWEQFADDPLSALYIWRGGIAIYGAVLGGAVGAWLFARKRRLSFGKLADAVVPGLLLAQAIGRWGNYFNMEAYGPIVTDARLQFFPMAVLIPSGGEYVWHAATFFYESMWNLCGFIALWRLRTQTRRSGETLAWYLLIYGSGRFVIEQLRQDSLYLGSLRVSQGLSLLLCAAACLFLLRDRAALLCAALWLLHWGCLKRPALYALLMLAAGVCAAWNARRSRRALLWLIAAFALDMIGLGMALCGQPISEDFALWLHTLLCSAALPLNLYAVWMPKTNEKEGSPCPSAS